MRTLARLCMQRTTLQARLGCGEKGEALFLPPYLGPVSLAPGWRSAVDDLGHSAALLYLTLV